ncbi:hypothetical protein AUP68_04878 [Ilyonectria robusta]
MKTFIALFLLNSFPGISATVSNPFDGVDPATVRCDAEYLNDAGAQASDRWAAAGAEWALETTNLGWGWYQGSADGDRLGYSEFVGNAFNSKDLMICQNMGDGPCQSTVTCGEVNQPAGFLILNSFVSLHVMHRNVWEGLGSAMNEMQNSMSLFQQTFSPAATPPKSSGWLSDLITVFQFAVGIGSAYIWNIAIKEAQLIANAGYHAVAQESANGAIGMAFTIGKNHLPTATAPEIQNDLTLSMGILFEAWLDAETDFLNQLFSGTTEALVILQGLVKDGISLELTRHLDLGTFVEEAQKIVYSQLVPIAWKASSKQEKKWPMEPADCVTSGDELPDYISWDNAANMSVCYDGHTFFLGFPTWKGEVGDFYPLPGGTNGELDGKKWGGLTFEDMVISAYEGWRLNGGKMGYEIPDNSKVIDGAGTEGGLILENGIRTPSFINLPICTRRRSRAAVEEFIEKDAIRMILPGDDLGDMPCGDGSLMEDEMGDWGF